MLAPGELSQGTKIIDVETGHELHGIYSIDLQVRVDDVIRATIGLLGVMGTAEIGEATFSIQDPLDGERHAIRRIEYADGTGLEVSPELGRLVRTNAER